MLRAMRTAATGMKSQQLNVDNIANNLANVNTNGFKKSRVNFQDLFYQQTGTVGKAKASGISAPAGLQIGYGANAVTTQRLFTQGELMETANPTDMAIMGDGFFRLLTPNGDSVYTRDGNFSISGDGQLVSSSGYVLDPGIVIPEDTQEIGISEDGTVSVTVAGDPYPQILGEVELVRFVNPAGLKAQGQNVYTETAISGEAIPGMPGSSICFFRPAWRPPQ